MAYQFIHVSTFSVKTGGKNVAAEAGRKPEHSQHIDNPKPPVHLAGMSTDDAWDEIERRVNNTKTSLVDKKGITRYRKLRSDQLVMLAAVASWPTPTIEQDTEDPIFKEWIQNALDYLEKKHGKPLSAVLHLDETHPHIHFITAPDLENGQRMKDIHQGENAKDKLGGRSAGKLEKKRAFKTSMREYQDDYHSTVSIRYGHARIGPQRLRLTRVEHKTKEAENQRIAESIRQLEARDAEIGIKTEILDTKKSALEVEYARHNDSVVSDNKKINSHYEKQTQTLKAIKNREKILDGRIKNIEKREQKAEDIIRKNSGFYSRALSVVTLGTQGVDRRVREARKAAKIEAEGLIKAAKESLEKTKRVAAIRKNKISALENDLTQSKKALKESKSEIQDLKNEVAGMQESIAEQRKERLPLEGDIATFEKKNRTIGCHLDSLKASLEDMDIDKAKKYIAEIDKQISVMPKTGNSAPNFEKSNNQNALKRRNYESNLNINK